MADKFSDITQAAEEALADEKYCEAARRLAEWNARGLPGDHMDYPDYPGESAGYMGWVAAGFKRRMPLSPLAVGAALKLATNIVIGRISSLSDPKSREIIAQTGRGTFDMES